MKRSIFQMRGLPKILKIEFDVNKEFDFEKANSLKLEFDITHTIKKYKDKNEAIVKLSIIIFPNEIKAPFSCKTEAVAQFIWGEGVPEETITQLLNTNAPALILSYVRPIISQITTFSGQPPFIIPLLDLTKN